MKKETVSSSNFTALMICLGYMLTMLISAGGIALWPVYIVVLLLFTWLYNGILSPAGAFVTYHLHADTLKITHVLTRQTNQYALQGVVHLYLYPALIPHLVISNVAIASKRDAKKLIRRKEVGCVTLWGKLRAALASYEKHATRLS